MKSLSVLMALSAIYALGQAPESEKVPAGGSVSGLVSTRGGVPLANAYVSLVRPRTDGSPLYYSVRSDQKGSYAFTALPTATYFLCVTATAAVAVPRRNSGAIPEVFIQPQYLDPCVWGNARRIAVAAGLHSSGDVVVDQGVQVSVIARDNARVLSIAGARFPIMSLQSELGEPKAWLQPRVAQDGLVIFSAVVPMGIYRLAIDPNGVALKVAGQTTAVQTGIILDASTAVKASVASGSKEIIFNEVEILK